MRSHIDGHCSDQSYDKHQNALRWEFDRLFHSSAKVNEYLIGTRRVPFISNVDADSFADVLTDQLKIDPS